MNYAAIRDKTVMPTLKKLGQPITIKSPTGGAYDPITGGMAGVVDVSYTGYGVEESYSMRDIDGTIIKTGDKKISCMFDNVAVIPTTDYNLTVGGLDYAIQNVDAVAPAGVTLIWTLQVRR